MRILFLGNSNEALSLPAGAPKRHEIISERLSADGVSGEFIVRGAWPSAEFPGVLDGWLKKYSPDLVYLNVAEYWCLYESVPLRIERQLGKLGKPLAKAGIGAADTPWLAQNRAFRKLRESAQSVIEGATYFSPAEVVSRVVECVRVCLRNENTLVVVDGQRGRRPHATTRRGVARVEARRQFVHRHLKDECARLHVAYGGDDLPQWQSHPEGVDGHADGLHQGAAGQVWMANEAIELIRTAIAMAETAPQRT